MLFILNLHFKISETAAQQMNRMIKYRSCSVKTFICLRNGEAIKLSSQESTTNSFGMHYLQLTYTYKQLTSNKLFIYVRNIFLDISLLSK